MAAEDEARALAYRQQDARRVTFQRRLDAALAGNPAARAELTADWQPLVAWLGERHEREPLPEPPRIRGN